MDDAMQLRWMKSCNSDGCSHAIQKNAAMPYQMNEAMVYLMVEAMVRLTGEVVECKMDGAI